MLRNLILLIVTLAVGLAAASGQSFWIDEGGTAFRAMMPTLKEWWQMILFLKGSDIQMASYMYYAWLWHQKLGFASEYALRLSNLPWLIITVFAFRRVRFWPLVCLLSPFVLYFVDEFRPYSMQIAAGACAAAALYRVIEGADREGFVGVHAVCGACLFLIACSLNGAVFAAGVSLGAVIIRPEWIRTRGFWMRTLPWLAASMAMGGFYVWTLMMGFRATKIESAGILNVLFGFYEMAGLLGLGPGKNELRRSLSAILPHLWILIPATACMAGAWWFGFYRWVETTPRHVVVGIVCAVALPILILTAAGAMMDFQVLGRHLSPAIPAVLLPLAHCLNVKESLRRAPLLLGLCACLLMLISSLGVRFSKRHAKDDYRQATEIAIAELAKGKRVLWQADMTSARYYAFRKGGMALMDAIQVLESEPPTGLMFADIIILNRPEIAYGNRNYQEEFRNNFFKLNTSFAGFEIWETQ